MSPPSMELTNHPGAAASIDADEFELICHSHSHSPPDFMVERGGNGEIQVKIVKIRLISPHFCHIYILEGLDKNSGGSEIVSTRY